MVRYLSLRISIRKDGSLDPAKALGPCLLLLNVVDAYLKHFCTRCPEVVICLAQGGYLLGSAAGECGGVKRNQYGLFTAICVKRNVRAVVSRESEIGGNVPDFECRQFNTSFIGKCVLRWPEVYTGKIKRGGRSSGLETPHFFRCMAKQPVSLAFSQPVKSPNEREFARH